MNETQIQNNERVTMLRNKVAEAVRGYGALRAAARIANEHYGIQWITAPKADKVGQADRKELRGLVTSEAEKGGHSNPRKVWADFQKYAKEEAGVEGIKGEKTELDRVIAALGSIRKNLPDCNSNAVGDLPSLFNDVFEEAERLGLIKPQE
jgi:hypothetical protein